MGIYPDYLQNESANYIQIEISALLTLKYPYTDGTINLPFQSEIEYTSKFFVTLGEYRDERLHMT